MKVLVIHGPNLNLLGMRETDIYGIKSLEEINNAIRSLASELDIDVNILQLNSEGEIIDAIQKHTYDALIINPAAYTHTSIEIRDALLAVGKPSIEVPLSNIYRREAFRRRSFMAGVAVWQKNGVGAGRFFLSPGGVKK